MPSALSVPAAGELGAAVRTAASPGGGCASPDHGHWAWRDAGRQPGSKIVSPSAVLIVLAECDGNHQLFALGSVRLMAQRVAVLRLIFCSCQYLIANPDWSMHSGMSCFRPTGCGSSPVAGCPECARVGWYVDDFTTT